MRRTILPLVLLSLVLAMAGDAMAQTFSVKGVLRDPLGRTVTDGSYRLTFRLYNAATAGTELWNEVHGSVTTKHGVFSAELGTNTALTGVSFLNPTWLGITVENENEMTPRMKLTTVPVSLAVQGVDNRFPSTGDVGIGITAPEAGLHVVRPEATSTPSAGVSLSGGADGNANIELVNDGTGEPYIDFTNDAGTDFDARIQLMGDDDLLVSGGRFGVSPSGSSVSPNPFTSIYSSRDDHNFLTLLSPPDKTTGIYFGDTDNAATAEMSFNHDSDQLQFWLGGDYRMLMKSDGKVGIGATSPQRGLHVVYAESNGTPGPGVSMSGGVGDNASIELVSDSGTARPYIDFLSIDGAEEDFDGRLELSSDDVMAFIGANVAIQATEANARLGFGTVTADHILGLYDSADLDDWYGLGIQSGQFRLQTANSARFSFLAGDDNEIMTLNTDGNLQVQKVTFPDNSFLTSASLGATASGISNPGDVGITSGGIVNVDAHGAAGGPTPHANSSMSFYTGGNNFLSLLSPNTDTVGFYFGSPESIPLGTQGEISYRNSLAEFTFWVAGVPRMTMKSDGKIGIGTASPSRGLHVLTPEANGTPSAGVSMSGGQDGNASIEIVNGGSGSPYIDFTNDAGTDFDGRIELNSDSQMSLTTAASARFSFIGAGTEKMAVEPEGGLILPLVGEGLRIYGNNDAFGTNEDARVIQMFDTNKHGWPAGWWDSVRGTHHNRRRKHGDHVDPRQRQYRRRHDEPGSQT
jgi:hypothetical protein